ncbi:unnamed protein product [Polarella glacialis]|uniref:Uncharacterized protein n=1 Tax=Polarella glacialis TaxID=89957 RepID=A0A813G9B1_POLGL|nr:unnamed protein product [Polarella glacialis]
MEVTLRESGGAAGYQGEFGLAVAPVVLGRAAVNDALDEPSMEPRREEDLNNNNKNSNYNMILPTKGAAPSRVSDNASDSLVLAELQDVNRKLDELLLSQKQHQKGPLQILFGKRAALDEESWTRLTLALSMVCTFSLAPLVFGFPALRQMLLEEWALEDSQAGGASYSQGPERDKYFALVFTCGSAASQFGRLPFGIFVDRCGPRRALPVAALVVGSGAVLLALSSQQRPYYQWAYLLLGFGGSGVQVASMATAKLAQQKALVGTCVSMFYMFGFAVFRLAMVLMRSTGSTPQSVFYSLAATSLVLATMVAAVFPEHRHPQARPDRPAADLLRPTDKKTDLAASPTNQVQTDDPGAWPLLMSLKFWKLAAWFSCLLLVSNFFMATAALRLGPSVSVADLQPLSLDVVFVIMAPTVLLVGQLLQRLPGPEPLFAAIAALTALHSAGCLLPATTASWVQGQYVLYCVSRGWLFAGCFASVGLVFGYRHFGLLVGVICITGGAATLLVTPLVDWALASASGSLPFWPIDIAFVASSLAWAVAYGLPPLHAMCAKRSRAAVADGVDSSHVLSEQLPDVESDSVLTKVITRKIRRGCYEQYKIHMLELNIAAEAHPGFLGLTSTCVEPKKGQATIFVSVLRFQGLQQNLRWNESAALQLFTERISPLSDWSSKTQLAEPAGRALYVSLPSVDPSTWSSALGPQVAGLLLVWLLSSAAGFGFSSAACAASPATCELGALAPDGPIWPASVAWSAILNLSSLVLAFGVLSVALGPQVIPRLKDD